MLPFRTSLASLAERQLNQSKVCLERRELAACSHTAFSSRTADLSAIGNGAGAIRYFPEGHEVQWSIRADPRALTPCHHA